MYFLEKPPRRVLTAGAISLFLHITGAVALVLNTPLDANLNVYFCSFILREIRFYDSLQLIFPFDFGSLGIDLGETYPCIVVAVLSDEKMDTTQNLEKDSIEMTK